eukprot:4873223-Pyramimonas_sp.AAC.1
MARRRNGKTSSRSTPVKGSTCLTIYGPWRLRLGAPSCHGCPVVVMNGSLTRKSSDLQSPKSRQGREDREDWSEDC